VCLTLRQMRFHLKNKYTISLYVSVPTINSSNVTNDSPGNDNSYGSLTTVGWMTEDYDVATGSDKSLKDVANLPDDISTLSCDLLGDYGRWTFTYKYPVAEVQKLLCRCHGICTNVTVKQEIKEIVHYEMYDPMSEANRVEFAAVLTVLVLLFIIGVTGKLWNNLLLFLFSLRF